MTAIPPGPGPGYPPQPASYPTPPQQPGTTPIQQQAAIPSPYGYAGPPPTALSGIEATLGGLLDRLSVSVAGLAPQLDRDTIRPALKAALWLIIHVGGLWLIGMVAAGSGQQQGLVEPLIGAVTGVLR